MARTGTPQKSLNSKLVRVIASAALRGQQPGQRLTGDATPDQMTGLRLR